METSSDSPIQRITSLRETGMRVMPSTGHYEPVSDYYLQDESQDLRGRTVTGPDGDLGTVKDMLVDPDIQKVAMIELSDGRRIPIKYVRLHGSQVRIVTENQR